MYIDLGSTILANCLAASCNDTHSYLNIWGAHVEVEGSHDSRIWEPQSEMFRSGFVRTDSMSTQQSKKLDIRAARSQLL